MISLFIISIYFFILFKAKIKADEIDNIQPSDYILLITDLFFKDLIIQNLKKLL